MTDRVLNKEPNVNDVLSKRGYYKEIKTDSIGIMSGCVDSIVEKTFAAEYALNNTYGVTLINQTDYNKVMNNWPTCLSAIEKCRATQIRLDPQNYGINSEVNSVCAATIRSCERFDLLNGKSLNDIAAPKEGMYVVN
jgi:hypothetical protein